MKFVYYLLHLFFIMLFCNTVFAVVTDEEFLTLNKRVKSMEKTIRRLEKYLDKVDSIESEVTRFSSGTKSTQIQDNSSQDQKGVAMTEGRVDKRIKRLEDVVYELKDRAALMDMTEEIRRVQEYVCRNGHVFSVMSEDKKCPICGLKQKARSRFKLQKFARRESISERIATAVEEEFERRVIIGASGTGIFQQLISSDRQGKSRDKRGKKSFAEGSFDLLFIAKPLLYTTFFMDLESIGGNGPDEIIGSFSGLNDDSGSLQDDDGVDRVSVREVWLQSFLLDERLRLVGGKIDLTNYFDSNTVANDETTQFITSAFVNNPTLEVPVNGPGLLAFFDTRKGLTFGLGLQSLDNSGTNITDDIYGIAEIGYRSHFFFEQEGIYRLWGRTKGGKENNNGFGVSLDQNLTTRLTAFARYGANESEVDDATIASAWSAGLRLRSPFFSRVNDEVAFAFGMLDAVDANEESAAELYYKFQINDQFAITPSFQVVFDPAGRGSNDTASVIGIRTQLEF
ncbi:MAG: carbohydrate porin [Candidatus Scalindua sediminis]|nr:carbohydrate porin [Candidatus Scalindua sediminis]